MVPLRLLPDAFRRWGAELWTSAAEVLPVVAASWAGFRQRSAAGSAPEAHTLQLAKKRSGDLTSQPHGHALEGCRCLPAAMVGALGGALHGAGWIPERW